MSTFLKFNSFTPKAKNMVVAGGLTSFVFGVYFYTMRAVGGSDELQVAIDKFEEKKSNNEVDSSMKPKVKLLYEHGCKKHTEIVRAVIGELRITRSEYTI